MSTGSPPSSPRLSRKDFMRGLATAMLLPLLARTSSAKPGQATPAEVAPGVFVHTGEIALVNASNDGDISNSGIVIGSDAVAVIDTGGSFLAGKALREAVAQITGKPVRYVVNTHMHPDHVMGNAAFDEPGIEIIGHHKLPAALSARADIYLRNARDRLGEAGFKGTRIVLPTKLVTDTMDIDLGGRILTLKARPTAHTDNDLTVFDKSSETFFLGDLLFSGHIPTLDGSIVGWLKLIPELMQEKAARAIPGHGPKTMPWPDAIVPEQRYLETVARDVRAMIKNGDTLEQALAKAGQSERDNWQLFGDFNGMNVTAAFTELEWE